MSHSCNDFPIAGYWGRKKVHYNAGRTKSAYEAMYFLRNPVTRKPYTNAELLAALEERRGQYPGLALLLEPWIQQLTARAEKHPHAKYAVFCSDSTAERALARLDKLHGANLDALAHLLYRPLYERNLAYGDVTVRDFVSYQAKALYAGELPATRSRLMGHLKNVILPEIGQDKLKQLDSARQEKVLKAIRQKVRVSTYQYIKRAYKGLIQAIEDSGWKGCSAGMRLANILRVSSDNNSQIRKNYRVNHLDDNQRQALFALLAESEQVYDLFWVALLYSGMDPADIAGQTFGDIQELTLQDGSCLYTILVSRRVHKLHDRYSTLPVTNESFSLPKFRRVVLAPWAGDVLLRRLEELRGLGLTDSQIQPMRLSACAPGGGIVGPPELSARLKPFLKQARIANTPLTRTRKNGQVYRETLPEDVSLLLRDARYLAERCGADEVMLHAMFGDSWTDTDEEAYLDLLGDSYAVARYQRLRRWSPFSSASLPDTGEACLTGYPHAPARHILRVENPTDHPITLSLRAPYALNAYWTPETEERNTS